MVTIQQAILMSSQLNECYSFSLRFTALRYTRPLFTALTKEDLFPLLDQEYI